MGPVLLPDHPVSVPSGGISATLSPSATARDRSPESGAKDFGPGSCVECIFPARPEGIPVAAEAGWGLSFMDFARFGTVGSRSPVGRGDPRRKGPGGAVRFAGTRIVPDAGRGTGRFGTARSFPVDPIRNTSTTPRKGPAGGSAPRTSREKKTRIWAVADQRSDRRSRTSSPRTG